MTSIVFQFAGQVIPTSPIIISSEDLVEGVFAPHFIEALQQSIRDSNGVNHFTISLDIADLKGCTITNITNVLRGYSHLYLHRHAKPSGLSRYYPSAAMATSDNVMQNLNATERIGLLTVLHYLGNEHLLGMCMRSFSELLVGKTTEELRRLLGTTRSDYPTPTQHSQLRALFLV